MVTKEYHTDIGKASIIPKLDALMLVIFDIITGNIILRYWVRIQILVRVLIYIYTLSMCAAKALACLRISTDSPGPSFLNNVMICLFDLILYVPSTILQSNRDGSYWVEPVLS